MEKQYLQQMYTIVGLAMQLYNELGPGYAEPIYQECLSVLCSENNVPWEREKRLDMFFHGNKLKKDYFADFVCFDDIIVELKAVSEITNDHRAQLFNYLRITGLTAGVLINFGEPNKLHAERYLFNDEKNKFELVSGAKGASKYFPGSNVLMSDLM